jgi:hypothetical protein
VALSTNLYAYYKLDESSGNAADSSGNGYTMTNNNSTPFATGKINNGANLGTSEGNSYGFTNSSAFPLRGDYTVNFWIKVLTAPTTDDYIFSIYNQSTGRWLSFAYSYNGGTYSFNINASNNPTYISKTLTVGTWYMVTVEGNIGTSGLTQTVYVNGSSIGTALSQNYSPSSTSINIGGGVAAIIDEFGIWSRKLTQIEVTSLYNSGNGLQYPFGTIYSFACLPASFSYTPQSTGNKSIRKFAMLPATYTYTALTMAFSFAKTYLFTTLPATYIYTTKTIGNYVKRMFATLPATFTLTGLGMTFKKVWKFACQPAQYIYTTMVVGLSGNGSWRWKRQTRNVSTFTNQTKNSASWNNQIKN